MLEVELCSKLENGHGEMVSDVKESIIICHNNKRYLNQEDSIQKSIIECFENSDPIEVQQPPLTPTITRSAASTPNPFAADLLEIKNHRSQTPILNGHHVAATKSCVQPPPPLPPVPPRQRPQALPQMRIPINIVKRAQKTGNEQEKNENQNFNQVDAETPSSSPEKNEPKLNGNSCKDDSKLIIHDPCPCRSGAHPKTANVRPSNFAYNEHQNRGKKTIRDKSDVYEFHFKIQMNFF